MPAIMRKIIHIILVVAGAISGAVAQTRTVTGQVISGDENFPLPGVNIVIPGTTRGTTTDANGMYSIALAPEERQLTFSFLGYKTQTINVGDRTTVDVTLESDVSTLEELVVVGYGIQRKSDLTGAVSSVRGSDLTKIPSFNPAQSLQGKVPGVQVTSSSGEPGASPVVRIRGIGTFNNAAPIYVVDGVILNDISFLNAADIESLEVLKDASATAIYGSRGANGVIIITTKNGSGQEGTVISFSSEYSIQKLQKKIDLLNGREFATIANEITPGSYNNVDAVPNTDWQDLIFETAPIQNYQFSASGNSSRMQYYAGFGYYNQQGIIPKSNYERLSVRLNGVYTLSKSIRLGSNVTFAPYKQQNTNNNAVFVVYRAQPVITPFQPDGSYSAVPGVGNVLADIDYTNTHKKGIRLVGSFYTEVNFLKDFTFRSSFGTDLQYNKEQGYTPVYYVSPQQQNPIARLNKNYDDRSSWLWENTVTYKKESGKHRIDALAGYTMQNATSEFLNLQGQNIIRDDEDFWYLNQSNINPSVTQNNVFLDQNFSMISYLFRANYTYNNRYLFTATFRRDGSSKFSKSNRYANFPSLAVGWNIINESFMQNYEFLSNLKLRASWGIIGNEKIAYDRQFSAVDNDLNAVFGQNEVLVPGQTYGVTGNPNLTWENTYQTDVGLETGFFEDKLTVEVDYYNRTTKDILIDLAIPGYLGNGDNAKITYNAAEVLNRGFEFNIAYRGEINEIKYRVGVLGTTIHNETLKVSGSGEDNDVIQGIYSGNVVTSTRVGLPIGAFYGYKVDGLFQNAAELNSYPHLSSAEVGDIRFVDVDNNGILNSDDRTYIGSPIPSLIYGFNFDVSYKGFELSADFQGQQGNKIFNGKETVRPDLYNFEQHVFNRWTGEGTSTSEPKASAGGYNFLPSTRFIQDGSYLRLRSLTLGYDLPGNLLQKLYMKSARVYVRGTNLFTITKFTGYTPEIASAVSGRFTNYTPEAGTGDPLLNGVDSGVYPVPAIYSVGLNLTF